MPQKTRSELKAYFLTGKEPTQQEFADFIDSVLNLLEDGYLKFSEIAAPPLVAEIPADTLAVDTTNNVVYFKVGANAFSYNISIYTDPVVASQIIADDSGSQIPDDAPSTDVIFTLDPSLAGTEILTARIENAEPGVEPVIFSVNHSGPGNVVIDFETVAPAGGPGMFDIVIVIDGVDTNNWPMEVTPP